MAKKTTQRISTKQLMIDKSNSRMVLVAGIAAFIVVFSLVASKSLLGQMQYQNKVITEKKATLTQLEANLVARDSLVKSYNTFVARDINIIGGDSNATGLNNGNNAKIVTDALPYEYDFPALVASLEKVLNGLGVGASQITGTDDSLVQKEASAASSAPVAVSIPFDIQVTTDYEGVQKTLLAFQNSIRPFVISSVTMSSGGEGGMQLGLTAQTFYQPGKQLKITKEVVK